MLSFFSSDVPAASASVTYLPLTNFFDTTCSNCEGVNEVIFLAWTENLLVRSLTHSSLDKIYPQTHLTMALEDLFDNSLSTVFPPGPFAGFVLWESFRSHSSPCSSLMSDPTGDSVDEVLLKSLPS